MTDKANELATCSAFNGMTYREYVAAQIMAALVSADMPRPAQLAVASADTLIAELAKDKAVSP